MGTCFDFFGIYGVQDFKLSRFMRGGGGGGVILGSKWHNPIPSNTNVIYHLKFIISYDLYVFPSRTMQSF